MSLPQNTFHTGVLSDLLQDPLRLNHGRSLDLHGIVHEHGWARLHHRTDCGWRTSVNVPGLVVVSDELLPPTCLWCVAGRDIW